MASPNVQQAAEVQDYSTSQQWDKFKPVMYDWYIVHAKTLAAVEQEMAKRGFVASRRMYKSRFNKWGWGKYTLKEDWQGFAILAERERLAGRELRQVQIHRRIRNVAEFTRYLKSQKISRADFLSQALAAGVEVPDHIQPVSDAARMHQVGSVSRGSQDFDGLGNLWPNEAAVSELSTYLKQATNPANIPMPPGPPFVDLSETAGQITLPPPDHRNETVTRVFSGFSEAQDNLHGLSAPLLDFGEDIERTQELDLIAKAGQPISDDSLIPLLPTPIPGDPPDPSARYAHTEQHQNLMSTTFMSCMSAAAILPTQDLNSSLDLAKTWMRQALVIFKRMLAARDQMILITVHTILVWLQVHDTESQAESIIQEMYQTMVVVLGANDLLTMVVACMTSAAGKRLPYSPMCVAAMSRLVHDFEAAWGLQHPHTLVATYYRCFQMMVLDQNFADAEQELKKLHILASETLGNSSFFSVCVLATLSRAQTRQKKHYAALDTINQCLEAAPWGLNHPHRLELLKRKALICWSLRDKLKPEERTDREYWEDKIIHLYRIVVMGRVATLGRYHKHTEAAHDTLVQILVESGRYELDSVKGETHELLTKPQLAVSAYECWWWGMVPKDREGEQ